VKFDDVVALIKINIQALRRNVIVELFDYTFVLAIVEDVQRLCGRRGTFWNAKSCAREAQILNALKAFVALLATP